uniref:Serine/threonine-protein kinase PLK n=1 Tax=Diachasma muliebre TaxID=1309577 RepID=A0A291S6W9_9HYME|nr:polo-like kinase 3 [Diachasma muliebre]
MSRERDTIMEPPGTKTPLKNSQMPKYSNGCQDRNALTNQSTAKVNFGFTIRDTEVPASCIPLRNSQEIGSNVKNSLMNSLVNYERIFNPTYSPRTSTIRGSGNDGRVVATSFMELSVGVTCDTRRARSEPGSLSTTVITGSRTSGINQKRSNTPSRIASLDGLDSLVNRRSQTIGTSQNSHLQSFNATPVVGIGRSPSKNKLTSIWESHNTTGDSEPDYVVDPVQGNAYHKGPFLGKGGFARVYLMTDIANGKRYACKIIPKNRMQKIHIQKIAREIMIHKDLNHVNIVQMHHYFEDSLNVYMLLEACPRKSLMHVLKYRGKVTEPEARYYMKQMVTGVAYIHSQKVVHRDLKPGNMFLSDGMIVKIGDFGLATRPDGQKRRVTICGTPNYIAPEVLYKQAYSYEADVWALGCILYALLTGQPPFDTATLKETYSRICNNRYKKLNDTVVSRNGQDLIKCLLQPIPELRPSLETVKEHAYLTMEFVPDKLTHACCYRPPEPSLQGPLKSNNDKTLVLPTTSFPSATTLSSTSCTSTMSRKVVHPQIEQMPKPLAKSIETPIANGIKLIDNGSAKLMENNARLLPPIQREKNRDAKVGNWLVRKFPKLTKLRKRFGNLLCPDRKKSSESALMHHALENCLAEIRHTRVAKNPVPIEGLAPLFVTKWIDYSNKYGLCFQLSDRSVGVLFNDSTKMSYTRDRRRVEYTTPEDEVTRYTRERDVPSFLHEKLELLRHFSEYMDDHLTNGGEISDNCSAKLSRRNGSVPRMRRWLRTDKAIVMELTVPLLQVNFFSDHTKIVVSEGTRPKDYLVTYIDATRHTTSHWLNDLRDGGCTSELYERLNYVCRASREFSHLENNVGCSEISTNPKTSLRA